MRDRMAAHISHSVVVAMVGTGSYSTRAFFSGGVARKAVTSVISFQRTEAAAAAARLQSRPAAWGITNGTKRSSSSLIESRRFAYHGSAAATASVRRHHPFTLCVGASGLSLHAPSVPSSWSYRSIVTREKSSPTRRATPSSLSPTLVRRAASSSTTPTTTVPLSEAATTGAKSNSNAAATTSTDASTTSAATTTSTATTANSKPSISFMEWYEGHLQARPVVTKMISGGILWGLGDAVAQLVPILAMAYGGVVAAAAAAATASTSTSTDSSENNSAAATATTARSSSTGSTNVDVFNGEATESGPFIYDYMRTGRAVFYGCVIHAPLAHAHYNFLEWLTIRVGLASSTWGMPLFKAFMEQFVYWSWFSNALYHGSMGVLQGTVHTVSDAYQRIAAVLWETQKAQWVFWIPIQLVNFSITPVRHQLNVVLLTSVVWTALLSAWYPPTNSSSTTETPGKGPKDGSNGTPNVAKH